MALESVPGFDFTGVLHRFLSLTHLKGSWGQAWPEHGPNRNRQSTMQIRYLRVSRSQPHEVLRTNVVRMTLLRRQFLRGRSEKESPFCDNALLKLVDELLAFFNGDWRDRRVQHLCFGADCCRGGKLDAAVGRATSLLMSVLIDRLGETVPSENRWHTFGPSLEIQTFGVLFHGLLSRLAEVVNGSVNALKNLDASIEAGNEFQVYRAKKDRKCATFLMDSSTPVTIALAAVASEPVDHLSARMQLLDHQGHGVTELVADDLLLDCQRAFWAITHPLLNPLDPYCTRQRCGNLRAASGT
jgi:hypothetical protein